MQIDADHTCLKKKFKIIARFKLLIHILEMFYDANKVDNKFLCKHCEVD